MILKRFIKHFHRVKDNTATLNLPQINQLHLPQGGDSIKLVEKSLENATPLFVIGCPRSGTTFVSKLLNSHPMVIMTNETAVFMLLDDIIKRSHSGVKSGVLYGKEYNKLWSDYINSNYRLIIEDFYTKICECQKKTTIRYWGEKHPHIFSCLDRINSVFPDAKYIYIIRDPRDSASSIAKMQKTDYLQSLRNWKEFSDSYEGFVKKISNEKLFLIKYEELVRDYDFISNKIFSWLNLELDSFVCEFLAKYKNIDAHSSGGLINPFMKKDFLTQSANRWKKELTALEINQSADIVGDFLDKYDYQNDNYQNTAPEGHISYPWRMKNQNIHIINR